MFLDTGIDNGGKDGVTFEKFVFKRRSVRGDRIKRVEDMLKKEKELTKTDALKLDMVSTGRKHPDTISTSLVPCG